MVGIDYNLLRKDKNPNSQEKGNTPHLVLLKKTSNKTVAQKTTKSPPKTKTKQGKVKKAQPEQATVKSSTPVPSTKENKADGSEVKRLLQVIKKAMRQLGEGMDVAAYQTLENAL